ncbi:putative quinol monooxygenase [Methanobrevibacter sp.]|uniref:putative quinol monooxygenase n=1 Tax=Methanobrevibacter sp. TaxID=66852 RepID=UPI00386A0FF9
MIIVNANLPVKEEKKDEVIKQAEALINASRTHEGNISYNLYQDMLDDSLIFIEKWKSKESLEAHMQTPEFIEFGENIKESLTAPLDIKLIVGEEIEGN